jgi:DNA-binding response OmpR family regulator
MPYDVLVIDDELSLARNIKEYLEVDGLDADVCADGESAIELFAARAYPVVVLDLRLPGMDGNGETGVAALAAGAYDFIRKPLVLKELGRLVSQARGEIGQNWPTVR